MADAASPIHFLNFYFFARTVEQLLLGPNSDFQNPPSPDCLQNQPLENTDFRAILWTFGWPGLFQES